MRVRLNLATKPMESHRRFLAGSSVGAFLAFVVFVALSWHVHSVRKAEEEIRLRTAKETQERTKLETQRAELERFFNQKDISSLDARAEFLNNLIDARSFNWTQMFMDLERILPGGVRVISIEPKQSAGHADLKLTIGAASEDAKLKLLHALEQSAQFKDVQEQRDSASTLGGDQRVIQLTTVYFTGS